MPETERPTAAFILSLAGGVFIMLGGGIMLLFTLGSGGMMRGHGMDGMMGEGHGMGGMMGMTDMMASGSLRILSVLGLIFGVIVIVSALMLNKNPQEHSTWGTLIVIFSTLSLIAGTRGGLSVGLILGLIGGILAITWKPQTR